ncbi:uncharacterized protein [Lepeophtheirus salmonis]|uniref:uncharacterized protein n=1 Tax=Lepeophtheirus salmonis TaxID=72036 RepID=UPI001AE99421|nr:uncharacterized protein LOC121114998 [Lepeophtheirus salmonis]XP_040565070.1 uncharacterized protein LOC121114998 [Lepeophtheirus salmonis]
MVNYCRVVGCHNRNDKHKHLQFYRLPKIVKSQGEMTEKLSSERRRLWIDSLKQNFEGKNLDNIRVCSAHFVEGVKAELYKKDSPNWIPSLGMSPGSTGDDETLSRRMKAGKLEKKRMPALKKESVPGPEEPVFLSESMPPSPEIVEVQPDITGEYLDFLREEN